MCMLIADWYYRFFLISFISLQGCKQQFHVTCAQGLGLLCEEAGNYLDNVKYCGYCQHHYSKLVSSYSHKIFDLKQQLKKIIGEKVFIYFKMGFLPFTSLYHDTLCDQTVTTL